LIVVTATKKSNKIADIKTVGHANYAPKGQDIVCAAVSVLLGGLINEITRYSMTEYSAEDGFMRLKILQPNEKTKVLTEYVLNTLKSIETDYPANLKVITK
jgi:Predicted ribosomal protein